MRNLTGCGVRCAKELHATFSICLQRYNVTDMSLTVAALPPNKLCRLLRYAPNAAQYDRPTLRP